MVRTAGQTRALPADPKSIFRLLETIFQTADDRFGGRRVLATCTAEFLTGFGDVLGVHGALLYTQKQRRFRLVERIGAARDDAPSELPYDGSAREMLAATLPDATVDLMIEEPRARHRLVLLLDSDADIERAETVGQILRAALSARILQNRWGNALREAAEIQRGLLPAQPPDFPGFELAGRSQPAEEVGGDAFDFLHVDDRALGLTVADASGHGLPAALVARDVMVGLRMGVRTQRKVTRVLRDLNRVMHEGGLTSSFVSAFYGELTTDGALLYANAGHPPPLLRKASGIVKLAGGDTVLGPSADTRFRRHFCHLDIGDVLVAFTDGILERQSPDGAWYGLDGVKRVLAAAGDASAHRILEQLFDDAATFGAGDTWDDDATVLIVRRTAGQVSAS